MWMNWMRKCLTFISLIEREVIQVRFQQVDDIIINGTSTNDPSGKNRVTKDSRSPRNAGTMT
jgi:hypothetical protein